MCGRIWGAGDGGWGDKCNIPTLSHTSPHLQGPAISWSELTSFQRCSDSAPPGTFGSCEPFRSAHPRTIAMTVLVVIEMFNALNNLSEDASLLQVWESVDGWKVWKVWETEFPCGTTLAASLSHTFPPTLLCPVPRSPRGTTAGC